MNKAKPPLELNIVERTVQSGAVPVVWCIDREWATKSLKDIRDCYILLITTPVKDGHMFVEDRVVAKATSMMAYVNFFRPGKNRIYAFLTNSKSTATSFTMRYHGAWRSNFIAYHNRNINPVHWDTMKVNAELDVDLPKECFAKEPPAWEKAWVNVLFSDKAVDQCAYRRRRIFAYTLQPLVFTLLLICRLLITFALLSVACRGINFRPLYQPFAWSAADIWLKVKGTYLYIPKAPFPFNGSFVGFPLILLAAGLIVCF